MSRYIKQDDVFELVRTGVLVSNSNFESVCKHIGSLPTIEVSEDCISRVGLFEKMQSLCTETDKGCGDCHKACDIEDCLDFVMDAPSVIAKEKEGEWIESPYENADGMTMYRCSECGCLCEGGYNYCFMCGAKMRDDNVETD